MYVCSYILQKNIGGSNIWRMVEIMQLARFKLAKITLVYVWQARIPYYCGAITVARQVKHVANEVWQH